MVAIACNWLPHNLGEVAQAIYDYIDGKEPMLPGPDFPTGGYIINKDDIPNIMKTGHGSVKVRGKYKIEKERNIVFYEIPYGVSIESLLTEIGEVCEAKEVEGVEDLRDESNKEGVRIVIECKKGVNVDSIANKLYNKTNLQTSISYNQVALVDKTPTELNLKQCIEIYLRHNESCLKKELNFDLNKAKDRLHIIEGLLIALEDIDNVIALIKKSDSSTTAKSSLMTKYKLSEEQAKSILAMRLSSLAKLEKLELENEKKELVKKVIDITDILAKEERQIAIIKERLETLVKKFGDPRRTELMQINLKPEEKDIAEVTPDDVVVITTKTGLIKKILTSAYKVQRRGGKGVKSKDDAILSVIKTNTIDYLLLFSDKGKMYRTIVDNVPTGTNATKGVPISSFIQMADDEKIIAVTSLHRAVLPKFVIFGTKNGMIKKSFLEEYMKAKRNTGIAALNLKEGDSIVNVIFQDEEDLIIITKNGMSIRFSTKEIGAIGRVATGVKGIKLDDGDEVVAILPIHKESDKVAVFTSAGMGKKVELKDFPKQNRGGKGTYVYKPTDSTGLIIGASMVDDNDTLLLAGDAASICITAKDIPLVGKLAQGNILTKNKIASITKI